MSGTNTFSYQGGSTIDYAWTGYDIGTDWDYTDSQVRFGWSGGSSVIYPLPAATGSGTFDLTPFALNPGDPFFGIFDAHNAEGPISNFIYGQASETLNIPEGGGSSSRSQSGGKGIFRQDSIDPDEWLTTFQRAFKQYVSDNIDLEIYDLMLEFPSSNDLGKVQPLDKTILHFEFDDIRNSSLGFGDSIVDATYDDTLKTVVEYEAKQHDINCDVGVWASARSGGVTSRLQAYEILDNLFCGPSAFNNAQSYGFEIKSFNGGTFLKEEIDDIPIYRVANMTLIVRVFSRKVLPAQTYIDVIGQDEELKDADGNAIV